MYDELLLIASVEDSNIYVLDLYSGTHISTLKSNLTGRYGLTVLGTPSNGLGRHFLSSQNNKPSICIWHVNKDQPLFRCAMPESIGPMISTGDGRFVIGGGRSGKLFLWEVTSGALFRTWEGHYKSVSSLSLSSDSSLLLSGGEDGMIALWSIADLLEESTAVSPLTTWTEHSLPVTGLHCGFGGTRGRAFSCSLDGTARVWDLITKNCLSSIVCPSELTACTVDPQELRLFAGANDGQIFIVDLLATASAQTAAASKEIWVGGGGRIQETGHASIPREEGGTGSLSFLSGHQKQINALTVTANGALLVSGSEDGLVMVWEPISRQAVKTFDLVKGPVSSIFLLHRAETLFISGAGGKGKENDGQLPVAPLKKYRHHAVGAKEVDQTEIFFSL